jgi:hypothetical protein
MIDRLRQAINALRDYEGVINGPTRMNLIATLEPGLQATDTGDYRETLKGFADLCLRRGLSGKMAKIALLAAATQPSVGDGLHAASENMNRITMKAVGMRPRIQGLKYAMLAVAEALRHNEDPEKAAWDFAEKHKYADNGAHCFAVLVSGFLGNKPEPKAMELPDAEYL